jgi:tetratricopeptide (TPR) repeat protein
VSAVISLDTQTFLGHNQATYQDLLLALQLNLRRQLLLAVCDDAALQIQLAHRLEADLNSRQVSSPRPTICPTERGSISPMVTLSLNTDQPDPVRQVLLWLKQHRLLKASAETIPAFQIVGLEQLTQRSPTLQNTFLASLTYVDALITRLDCRLLIWVPRPWLGKIRQAVPGFWRSRSGSFEFVGDPTPTADRPISFDIAQSLETRPARAQATGTGLDLPKFEPSGRTAPTGQASLQPRPPASSSTPSLRAESREGKVPLPPDAPSSQPSALPRRSDEKATSQFADQFTVVDDAPLSATILPPAAELATTEFSALVFPDELANSSASTETESENSLPTAQSPSLPQSSDANLLEERKPPSSSPVSLPVSLPDELATDQTVVALWQYIHTLEVQHAGPMTLARACLGLGQKSRDLIEAGSVTLPLLDFAIEVYGQAISGLLEGEDNWCDALNDLASLYWLRSQQEEATDAVVKWLQHSIAAYQKALTRTHTKTNPETQLRLYSNLGTVYSLLAGFDEPIANLQQSLNAYRQALSYGSVEIQPVEYANLQNSLGAVHWRLAQLEQPQQHLRLAIQSYSEALKDRHPQTQSLDYAMIQNNLGIAYWNLAQHESPLPCLENAITAYQTALKHRTVDTFPHGCAATHNNLGTAYWDIAQQYTRNPDQRLAYLHKSVEAYEEALNAAEVALQVDPQQALGFDVWATAHSAGVVHDQLAQGLPSDQAEQRKGHLHYALEHYLLAYQGWQDSPQQLEVLVTAFVYNIHLSYDILGLSSQQAVLSRVPGELLPDILRQL